MPTPVPCSAKRAAAVQAVHEAAQTHTQATALAPASLPASTLGWVQLMLLMQVAIAPQLQPFL